MKYFENINKHKYLFLRDLRETDENDLRLIIEEAKATGPKEDLRIGEAVLNGTREIASTDDCAAYEVLFENYIGYSVMNESYMMMNDHDEYEGQLFRVYAKSHFLNYVSRNWGILLLSFFTSKEQICPQN